MGEISPFTVAVVSGIVGAIFCFLVFMCYKQGLDDGTAKDFADAQQDQQQAAKEAIMVAHKLT